MVVHLCVCVFVCVSVSVCVCVYFSVMFKNEVKSRKTLDKPEIDSDIKSVQDVSFKMNRF